MAKEGTTAGSRAVCLSCGLGAFDRQLSEALPTAARPRFALRSKVLAGVEAVFI